MKTKIAIVSGILFAAIIITGISSSFMFPGLTCPAGTIVKNDVCVIASTDSATYCSGVVSSEAHEIYMSQKNFTDKNNR